jgi:hypothetical protein
MSVNNTAKAFGPISGLKRQNMWKRIAELEEKQQLYESEMAHYSQLIHDYKAYIALFNGNYWEDDTIHRDEAYRRHWYYCIWKERHEELSQKLTQIISDISIIKTDLEF